MAAVGVEVMVQQERDKPVVLVVVGLGKEQIAVEQAHRGKDMTVLVV
jgi:hypothetical protein